MNFVILEWHLYFEQGSGFSAKEKMSSTLLHSLLFIV